MRPVKTQAEGLEYKTLIIPMKVLPRPVTSKTDHKNGHSSLSKAFIASRERSGIGVLLSFAASTMWRRRLTLSAASLVFMNPVWSEFANFAI